MDTTPTYICTCMQDLGTLAGIMAKLSGTDYQAFFTGREYLSRRFVAGPNGEIDPERNVQPFYLKCFHEFYQQFHGRWDNKSARVLEFGGGPTIYPLISAAPHVNNIVFSDYVESCRKEVQLWKDQDPEAHNWTPYFRYVVQELEQGKNPELVSEREKELRNKISSVLHCDLTAQDILSTPQDPFDIVSANYVIEVVSNSLEDYQRGLMKLSSLLKPNGFLVVFTSLEESFYYHNGEKYDHFYITSEQVHKACEMAGLSIAMSKVLEIPPEGRNILNDCKFLEFYAAQKVL